jgi:hypothetical protein
MSYILAWSIDPAFIKLTEQIRGYNSAFIIPIYKLAKISKLNGEINKI